MSTAGMIKSGNTAEMSFFLRILCVNTAGRYISLTPSPWTTQMDYPRNTISNEYC